MKWGLFNRHFWQIIIKLGVFSRAYGCMLEQFTLLLTFLVLFLLEFTWNKSLDHVTNSFFLVLSWMRKKKCVQWQFELFSQQLTFFFFYFCWTVRIGMVYILSAFFGSLVATLFLQKSPAVGSSGALFGLLGSMLSGLICNWKVYTDKVLDPFSFP